MYLDFAIAHIDALQSITAYYLIATICYIISATVVLVGNKKLRRWLSKKYLCAKEVAMSSVIAHSSFSGVSGVERENTLEAQL